VAISSLGFVASIDRFVGLAKLSNTERKSRVPVGCLCELELCAAAGGLACGWGRWRSNRSILHGGEGRRRRHRSNLDRSIRRYACVVGGGLPAAMPIPKTTPTCISIDQSTKEETGQPACRLLAVARLAPQSKSTDSTVSKQKQIHHASRKGEPQAAESHRKCLVGSSAGEWDS
jgi:hypothetical protein